MMQYNKLGVTGISVSSIGYGTWGLGGDSYGPIEPSVSENLLKTAKDRGINFFETADLYGDGAAEIAIGKAFTSYDRQDVVIATKGGNLPHRGFIMPQDFSRSHLESALSKSLGRLNTDYVDLYMLHSPNVEDGNAIAEAVETLKHFVKSGKIRAYGIAFRSPLDAIKFLANEENSIDVISVNCNVIDQRFIEIGLSKLCQERAIGVIARTPLCFGFLSGQFSAKSINKFGSNDHRSNWPKGQIDLWASAHKKFSKIISRLNLTPTEFALGFCKSIPSISSTITGMMNEDEIFQNTKNLDIVPYDDEIMHKIAGIYKAHNFYDPKSKLIEKNNEENSNNTISD
jgi:aryl-alcohol dehydrogenase-like predicted oxidoreductase